MDEIPSSPPLISAQRTRAIGRFTVDLWSLVLQAGTLFDVYFATTVEFHHGRPTVRTFV